MPYLVDTDTGDACHEFTELAYCDGELRALPTIVLCRAPYRRCFIRLRQGVAAYVCTPTRDRERSEAWTDGISGEQPAFERVTDAFEHKGVPHYWGLVRRHAFLMELPTGRRSD